MAIFAFVWLTGAAAIALARVVATLRLAHRLRLANVIDDSRLAAIVAHESQRIGLRAVPRCIETGEVESPALFGFWRAQLLFPRGLIATLSNEELRLVVLHELAHFRRGDLFAHALLQVAVAVHWFNPLAWIAARLARTDCELACDAFVLRHGRATHESYGTALLRVLGALRSARRAGLVVVSIVEGKQQLVERVRRISEFRRPRGWQTGLAATVIAALAIGSATREGRAEPAASSTAPVAANPAVTSAPAVALEADRSMASTTAVAPVPSAKTLKSTEPVIAEASRRASGTEKPQSERVSRSVFGIDAQRDRYNEALKLATGRRDDLKRSLSQIDARIKLVEEYREQHREPESLPFIAEQSPVGSLTDQIARKKIDIGMLSQRYGDRHPDLIRAKQELANLVDELNEAIKAAFGRLQAQRDTTAADLRIASEEYARIAAELDGFERDAAEYHSRERASQSDSASAPSAQPSSSYRSPVGAEALREQAADFTVSVLGAVNRQQAVGFTAKDSPIVLDAIARAGGFSPNANRGGVTVLRVQKDGSRKQVALNESDLMSGTGDAARVQAGDVIVVPERPGPQFVTILGSVNKPGHVELPEASQPKMTIVELLARAGGPNRLADLRHVRIRRANAASGAAESTVINVDDVLSAKAPMEAKLMELQPGDIVTVPERVL